MNLKEIRQLVALMNESDLVELEMEEEGNRIRLKRGVEGMTRPEPLSRAAPSPSPLPSTPRAAGPLPGEESPPVPSHLKEIPSPMVGTFYRAPSPDSDPFVETGQAVTPDTVVCIIEAMKVMNEVKAEREGKIVEILVENGQAVEFGQPLFRVEP